MINQEKILIMPNIFDIIAVIAMFNLIKSDKIKMEVHKGQYYTCTIVIETALKELKTI